MSVHVQATEAQKGSTHVKMVVADSLEKLKDKGCPGLVSVSGNMLLFAPYACTYSHYEFALPQLVKPDCTKAKTS